MWEEFGAAPPTKSRSRLRVLGETKLTVIPLNKFSLMKSWANSKMAGHRFVLPDLASFVVPNVRPTGRELGRGAYGSVEEVEIPGAVCAAKKIHTEFLNIGSREDITHIVSKFASECRLMSKLRHPQIVQFLGVCYLPGARLPSLVMERLDTSLHELLETTPNLPLSIKKSILLDTARGLLYLHSQSPPIIHRDLTARNVLLNSAMVAKIADLGVARIVNLQPDQLATMTQGPGNIVYMPPEAMGEHTQYNTSLDIFSFGNIALFTLTQVFVGPKLKAAAHTLIVLESFMLVLKLSDVSTVFIFFIMLLEKRILCPR